MIGVNNPGNIRAGAGKFYGEVDPVRGFRSFNSLTYGYRAMMKILQTYHNNDGLKTISQIVNRYAPPSDNNPTSAYAAFVAHSIGVDVNQDISKLLFNHALVDIVASMSNFEQGGAFKNDYEALEAAYNIVEPGASADSSGNELLPIALLLFAALYLL